MGNVGTGVQVASSPKSSGIVGGAISFVLADWVLNAGQYFIDLQHNLESLNVSVEIYEGINEVDVNRVEIFNTNTVRIYTTMSPDCRFEGKAIIIAI